MPKKMRVLLLAVLLLGVAEAQVDHVKGKVERVDSHGSKTTTTMIDRVTTVKGDPKIDRKIDKTVDKTRTPGMPGDHNGKKAISGVFNGTEKTASRPKSKS